MGRAVRAPRLRFTATEGIAMMDRRMPDMLNCWWPCTLARPASLKLKPHRRARVNEGAWGIMYLNQHLVSSLRKPPPAGCLQWTGGWSAWCGRKEKLGPLGRDVAFHADLPCRHHELP